MKWVSVVFFNNENTTDMWKFSSYTFQWRKKQFDWPLRTFHQTKNIPNFFWQNLKQQQLKSYYFHKCREHSSFSSKSHQKSQRNVFWTTQENMRYNSNSEEVCFQLFPAHCKIKPLHTMQSLTVLTETVSDVM